MAVPLALPLLLGVNVPQVLSVPLPLVDCFALSLPSGVPVPLTLPNKLLLPSLLREPVPVSEELPCPDSVTLKEAEWVSVKSELADAVPPTDAVPGGVLEAVEHGMVDALPAALPLLDSVPKPLPEKSAEVDAYELPCAVSVTDSVGVRESVEAGEALWRTLVLPVGVCVRSPVLLPAAEAEGESELLSVDVTVAGGEGVLLLLPPLPVEVPPPVGNVTLLPLPLAVPPRDPLPDPLPVPPPSTALTERPADALPEALTAPELLALKQAVAELDVQAVSEYVPVAEADCAGEELPHLLPLAEAEPDADPAATLLLPSAVPLPLSEPPPEPLPPAVEDTVATDRVGRREPVLPPDLLALPLPPTLPLKLGSTVAAVLCESDAGWDRLQQAVLLGLCVCEGEAEGESRALELREPLEEALPVAPPPLPELAAEGVTPPVSVAAPDRVSAAVTEPPPDCV